MNRGLLLILPAAVPTALVLGTSLVVGLGSSLGLMPLVGAAEPTPQAYRYVLGSTDLRAALILSVAIAATATAIAAVVGLAAAVAIRATARGGRLLGGLAGLTIPIPHLVGAAAIGLLLSDSGLLARISGAEPGSWPQLVAGPWWIAVVAEYAWKESAFIALVVLASLSAEADVLDETAAVLGARPWQRVRAVTIPLAAPALIASATISFVYALGSFEVAWLLGRAYPEPLPVLAYRLFTSTDLTQRPAALAVAMLTVALCAGAAAAGLAALRRTRVVW